MIRPTAITGAATSATATNTLNIASSERNGASRRSNVSDSAGVLIVV